MRSLMNGLPKRIDKPWGYELLWAQTEWYVGKILHINRGESLSFQYHEKKEETQYVLSGQLSVELQDPGQPLQTLELKAGQVLHLKPLTRHRLTALEDTDVLEASTPELDDVVRLEDRYGRAGTSKA